MSRTSLNTAARMVSAIVPPCPSARLLHPDGKDHPGELMRLAQEAVAALLLERDPDRLVILDRLAGVQLRRAAGRDDVVDPRNPDEPNGVALLGGDGAGGELQRQQLD